MNLLGAAAIILSAFAFFLTRSLLKEKTLRLRIGFLLIFSVLSIPAGLFTAYYLHMMPDQEWFFTLRSWTGTEFLAVFMGCAGGAAATFLPRILLAFALAGVLAVAAVPYLKPVMAPLSDGDFDEMSEGDVCLQSTSSTCGPASLTTILRRSGVEANEKEIARAAYSYAGGTEAWYLARYVRSRGLSTRFDFRPTFTVDAGQPVLVGVKMGAVGHFIAVLSVKDDGVTFADPLRGEEKLSIDEFKRRYSFTGFHMAVHRPGSNR